jgi:two-component system, LytTR family, sensor kinase
MTSKGFTQFWKHSRIAYHLKILAASMLVTALYLWIMVPRIEFSFFLSTVPLVFIQLEIFLWLGWKFFPPRLIQGKTTGSIIKRTLLGLVLYYLIILLIAALIFFIYLLFRALVHNQPVGQILSVFLRYESKGFFIGLAAGFLIGIVIFLYFQWREALSREQKLKEEKMIFRYETLKNQVNPHFLFNSLNTLASLVETKPAVAGSYITKLASIYRYILEKKELNSVPLIEELIFAKNYFDLQKIRDGEKIRLETDIPEPARYKILPISLQILLENVFKHNVASIENPLIIQVKLTGDGYLEVSNPLRLKNSLEISPGTGLHNLGERTRLISGKDIRIIETPDEFKVRIPLHSSDHENPDC